MKKILLLIITLLTMTMTNSVMAEISETGIIENIDLENNYIVVNGVQYSLIKGKTKLFSGKHILGLSLLREGMEVNYLLDDVFVVEIRLTTPYEFNE